jgi:hypothetical protein
MENPQAYFTNDDIKLINEEVEEELDERGYPDEHIEFISEHPTKNYEIKIVIENRKLDRILKDDKEIWLLDF